MEKLRMCRLCMAEEVRLHNIVNTHLQEMYESLILIPLETTDRRPIQACYICCARLENCYQLRKRGLRSEELFTQMLTADIMQMQTDTRSFRAKRVTGELSNGLASTTVVHLTVGDVPQESRDAGVKLNPPGVLEDPGVRIKEEKDKEALYKSRTQLLEDDQSMELEDASSLDIKEELLSDDEIHIKDELLSDDHTEMCEDVPPNIVKNENFRTNIEDELPTENHTEICEEVPRLEPHVTLSIIGKKELQDFMTSAHEAEKISSSTKIDGAADATSYRKEQTVAKEGFTTNSAMIEDKIAKNTISTLKTVNVNYSRNEGCGGLRVYSRSVKNTSYTCDFCKKGFVKKSDLLKHTFNIHPSVQNDESKPVNIDSSFTMTDFNEISHSSTDDKCNKCFTRTHLLHNHVCLHSNLLHPCTEYKKSFDRKAELDVHMRVHTGEKPYVCDICKQGFTRKYSLQVHLLVHAGKRYQCNNCNKSFKRSSSLRVHMRIHTGTKPYQCDVCL